MFMYGEQNSSLSYLPKPSVNGIELAEIPHSAHWPMCSNPAAMREHIAGFHFRRKTGLTACRDTLAWTGSPTYPPARFLQPQAAARRPRKPRLMLAGLWRCGRYSAQPPHPRPPSRHARNDNSESTARVTQLTETADQNGAAPYPGTAVTVRDVSRGGTTCSAGNSTRRASRWSSRCSWRAGSPTRTRRGAGRSCSNWCGMSRARRSVWHGTRSGAGSASP